LRNVAVDDDELDRFVALTGSVDGRDFGYTYSDLRQRFVPEAVIKIAGVPQQPFFRYTFQKSTGEYSHDAAKRNGFPIASDSFPGDQNSHHDPASLSALVSNF
jgi:hypothetical protein